MAQPVKIADDLLLDARMMAKLGHRSIAGQIEFWARLGEALEPLLQGQKVAALLKAQAVQPLSALVETIDTAEGHRRVAEYLAQHPFPHYEAVPDRPGLLCRIESDGRRTMGRFVQRKFVAVD